MNTPHSQSVIIDHFDHFGAVLLRHIRARPRATAREIADRIEAREGLGLPTAKVVAHLHLLLARGLVQVVYEGGSAVGSSVGRWSVSS